MKINKWRKNPSGPGFFPVIETSDKLRLSVIKGVTKLQLASALAFIKKKKEKMYKQQRSCERPKTVAPAAAAFLLPHTIATHPQLYGPVCVLHEAITHLVVFASNRSLPRLHYLFWEVLKRRSRNCQMQVFDMYGDC